MIQRHEDRFDYEMTVNDSNMCSAAYVLINGSNINRIFKRLHIYNV